MIPPSREAREYENWDHRLDPARGCFNGIILGALTIGLVAVFIWAASS